MALSYDQITGITHKFILPKTVDNIFNKHPILKRLKASEMSLSGGDKIMIPTEYATNSASGWYQGSETLDISDYEVLTSAEYDWKQLYANVTISRRDELRNMGDAGVVNFVKAKMKNAEKTMRENLSEGIYSDGTDAKSIVGLDAIISTANTIGNIDQSSYSWWQGNVDSSSTTLTIAAMQSLYGDCGEGTEYPTLIVGDQDMYDRYYNLLQPQQRFQAESEANGGFKSLMFNGIPFMVDSKASSGYLYMINEEYLKLVSHKDENMRMEPFAKPLNQNLKLSKIYWMGAIISSNNRRHGLMSAITA